MQIKYYSYDEELIKDIGAGKIYIFPKSVDKSLGKKIYLEDKEGEINIFLKQPKFMGLGEFKTNLFLSNEFVLREEKQVIAFYRSLSSKNKKELGVTGYYDVIDIAANFLNFFKLLKENRIEKLENLKKWQEKVYRLFIDLEKDYIKFLEIKNYTDPTFIIKDSNFTTTSLNGYTEIIIFNKLYFTPQEKWIIKKLEEEGFNIILKLQMKKDEFCEEKLKLNLDYKSIENLGEKEINSVEVFTGEEEFVELLKTLEVTDEKKEDKYQIFDANNDNYKYNSFFETSKNISDLPIFSLLDGIQRLLSTLEVIDNELALELHTVAEIIKNKEIQNFYNIKLGELDSFKNLLNKYGYKYLTKFIIGENLGETHFIYRIFCDIEKKKKYSSLKEWVEEISYSNENLLELLKGKENIGKYFEALSEIDVIEELDIVEDWEEFFGYGNISQGLLKLILKYLEFKEIPSDYEKTNEMKLKKSGLEDIKTSSNKNILFINLSDLYMPNTKQKGFLFTEQQKKELGIYGIDEMRIEEKYNFFRSVITSEKVVIISVKNMGSDSSLSPFVEEIVEKLNITPKHLIHSLDNYLELVELKKEKNNKRKIKVKPSDLEFKLEEIKNPFGINAYMCDELFKCEYKMYLRYLKKLNKEELKVDKNLTYREYGNLAHELFEAVLKKIELTKNYSHLEKGHIDVDIVEGVLKDLVGKNRLTLPKLNEKYYKEIVYKNLANSVEVFFKKISKELGNEKIEKLIVEEDLRSDFKNKTLEVIGRAKADLIIKTDKNIHIIDFKTGGINELQLDFYSILYAGESDKTIKYVFNVDKGELSKSKKIKLVRDNKGKVAVDPEGKNKNLEVLEVKIEEIFREKTFSRNEKQCGRCDYINICKIEEIEMAKKVGEIDGE